MADNDIYLYCIFDIIYSQNVGYGCGIFTDIEQLRLSMLKIFANICAHDKDIYIWSDKYFDFNFEGTGSSLLIYNIYKIKYSKKDKKYKKIENILDNNNSETQYNMDFYRTICKSIAIKEIYNRIEKRKKKDPNFENPELSGSDDDNDDNDYFNVVDNIINNTDKYSNIREIYNRNYTYIGIYGDNKNTSFKKRFPQLKKINRDNINVTIDLLYKIKYDKCTDAKNNNKIETPPQWNTETIDKIIEIVGEHKYDYKIDDIVIIPYKQYKKYGTHWEKMYNFFDVMKMYMYNYTDKLNIDKTKKVLDDDKINKQFLIIDIDNIYDDNDETLSSNKNKTFLRIKINNAYFIA